MIKIILNCTLLHIFISVINQLDAQILFYDKFISCLNMFRAHVLIIRRSKLHYTASGAQVERGLLCSPLSTCARDATYRCDDTRGCVMQF